MTTLIYSAVLLYLIDLAAVLAFHIFKRPRLEVFSRWALYGGFAVHTAALVLRAYSTGHAPMASVFETLLFFGWTTVLVTLFVVTRYGERSVELVTVATAALALVFALLNPTVDEPLPLVLKTLWFELHVSASFAAYALFTLAFAGACLYLLHDLRGGEDRYGAEVLTKYETIAGRSILWGFLFFSTSMFSGAVWAWLAWGTYWLWEPKVLWSFIVWFYFAGAIHAYYVRQWRGRGLAVATVLGFFVVVFTYLGVGLLMKSSHSF